MTRDEKDMLIYMMTHASGRFARPGDKALSRLIKRGLVRVSRWKSSTRFGSNIIKLTPAGRVEAARAVRGYKRPPRPGWSLPYRAKRMKMPKRDVYGKVVDVESFE